MRPEAAQWRFVPPCVVGGEPRSVAGLFQTCRPSPVAASAVQIDHACGRGSSMGSGAPPAPGRRTKARERPSGDQRGEESRPVEGASQSIGVCSFVKTPTKEWSPRAETKAIREPSGDHETS